MQLKVPVQTIASHRREHRRMPARRAYGAWFLLFLAPAAVANPESQNATATTAPKSHSVNCCDSFGVCEAKTSMRECENWAMSTGHYVEAAGNVREPYPVPHADWKANPDYGGCFNKQDENPIQRISILGRILSCNEIAETTGEEAVFTCNIELLGDCQDPSTFPIEIQWPAISRYGLQYAPVPAAGDIKWLIFDENLLVIEQHEAGDPCVQ